MLSVDYNAVKAILFRLSVKTIIGHRCIKLKVNVFFSNLTRGYTLTQLPPPRFLEFCLAVLK